MSEATRKTLLAVVLLATGMAATSASAASIPGLFDTGVLGDGTAAASGSVDLHYVILVSPDANYPGPDAIVADPIASGYWLANSPTSRWIAPAENQGYPSGAANHAPGDYVYRISFDLTGLDPATAQVAGAWAADNTGTSVRLNGVNTGFTTPSYSGLTAFNLTSGFVAGINTLDFVVNEFASAGANPTGLRVAGLTGTAAAVPIPAVAWLFGAALAGCALRGRHMRG